ncbi:MAG: LPS-assembly protein LptD [Acidobacteria bacterium]|nr:LPS-assembly protein LptD [Acidobacteriota bacterium]
MRLRSLTAVVAVVAGLLAASAGAGGETPKDTQETMTLHADNQQWIQKTLWRGEGNVEVLYQDIKIHCDKVELNSETMDLTASGNVVLDQGPRRFTADELHYNLKTKTGDFTNATGQVDPFYYFTGKKVIKLDETHFKLEKATFTSCQPEPRPPWRFGISKALIEEEGYGHFHGLTIQTKGVPIFYLPYLLWPVKTQRTTGLLVPTFGYSNRRGFYLGNALYIAAGRSWDTTVYLDLYSQGWLGLGSGWRWAPRQDAAGDAMLYTVRDKDTGKWEWKIDGKHAQDSVLGFHLQAQIHDLSDVDFFREYEHSFNQNTLRSLYSYVYLTKTSGPYSLNLRADRRITYLSSTDVTMVQLPEVELRVRPNRVGRTSLYWSLISSLNLFAVDRGPNLSKTYGRVDAYPQLSYTLPGPAWLTVTPRVAVRGTYYTTQYNETQTEFVDKGIDRSFFEGGIDIVGPSVSRVFEKEKGRFLKLKHLIEPRLEYRYVSDPGHIKLIPRFDEVDQTLVTNRLRLTLSNRLYGRERKSQSARELGSFDLFTDYSFGDPLTVSPDRKQVSRLGAVGGVLRATPSNSVMVEARAQFIPLFHNLSTTSLTASYRQRAFMTNLTWYQGFNTITGETNSSQVRAALALRNPGSRWNVALHVAYDVKQDRFQQQRIVFRYGGSCWGVTVEYRDLAFTSNTNRDIRIALDLKGLGKLLEIKTGLESY